MTVSKYRTPGIELSIFIDFVIYFKVVVSIDWFLFNFYCCYEVGWHFIGSYYLHKNIFVDKSISANVVVII